MEVSDSKESVAKGALHFLTGTFMSRLTGMVRDLSMAYCFGVSSAVGIFLIAFRLSNLLRRLFGEGALLNGFIPFFEAKRRKDPKGGAYFFRDVFWSLGLVLLMIVVGLELLLVPLCYSGFVSQTVAETLFLLIIQLPGLIFICLFGLSMALLQCEKNFFIPGVAPVAFNLIWIGTVWAVCGYAPDAAMQWLSIAVVFAFAFQWVVTIPSVKRYISSLISVKEWFSPKLFGHDLKLMISPVLYGVIGVAAVQINSSLDVLMARFVSPAGPALLSYAHRVQQLPIALFAIAISAALMPALTRSIKRDLLDEYRSLLQYGLKRMYSILFPGMIGIFVLGLASINLLYGRGEFSSDAVYNTTMCLWAYGMGLIPISFILLLAPAYYSRRDYRTPMIGSLISVSVNTTLNAIMIFVLKWPVMFIAVATSITAYVNLWFLIRRLHIKIFKKLKESFIKITLASICAGTVTAVVAFQLFNDGSVYLLFGDYSLPLARKFSEQFTHFTSLTFVYGVFFFFFAVVFKAKDALDLLSGVFPKKRS
ncbi:MAG: lipid II flippase MurJ [Chlamydiia bacterium]|nr:lipid II flippase MurJ [Chlamydiia bacterium]